MISTILKDDIFKVLSLYAITPGINLNREQIKNKLKINNVPLDKSLSKLLSSKILIKTKLTYSLNFSSESKIIIELIKNDLKKIKDPPLNIFFAINEIINLLSNFKDVEIILFGSYAKLIYRDDSDIDIAIISIEKLESKNIKVKLFEIEKKYGKKIEIHYFNKQEFYKNKKDPLIKEIITQGINLS